MRAIATFPDLLRHLLAVYGQFTADDMSDEEADPELAKEHKCRAYRVTPKGCYAEELFRCNQFLDAIYNVHIRSTKGDDIPPPALRVYGRPVPVFGTEGVVKGLPSNCYSFAWWHSLSTAARKAFPMAEQAVDLTIADDILKPKPTCHPGGPE